MARRRKAASGLRSMTGFGRGASAPSKTAPSAVVEVRSVNQRFLKLSTKLSGRLAALEPKIREQVQACIFRGAVDVFVNVQMPHNGAGGQLDERRVRGYVESWRALARRLKLPGDVSVETLAALPDLFKRDPAPPDPEQCWKPVSQALTRALDELLRMRTREGEALRRDLRARVQRMRGRLQRVEKRAPAVVEAYRKRLRARVRDLLSGEQPVATEANIDREVVFLAERSDISEEITRLRSHFEQFSAALVARSGATSDRPSVGKRLEFLVQEMNREVNTIGSKSSDEVISRQVIDMKEQIEKVREQTANVE